MNTTYLVYQQVNGNRQFVEATLDEWDAILKENRSRPPEQRRHFMKDCFEDGGELDCMYIEVTAEEHRVWNSQNTAYQYKRKKGALYTYISLDASIPDMNVDSLHECVPSEFDLERLAADAVLMDELKGALRKWKPWAEELFDLYMSGKKRSCTADLCGKYHLSDRAVRKRKEAFENFILNFLKK